MSLTKSLGCQVHHTASLFCALLQASSRCLSSCGSRPSLKGEAQAGAALSDAVALARGAMSLEHTTFAPNGLLPAVSLRGCSPKPLLLSCHGIRPLHLQLPHI